MSAALLDALDARSGIVCAIGAGGKKSTLYRLAAAHPGRVALTATTFTGIFPDDPGLTTVVANEPDLADRVVALGKARRLAYASPSELSGRHGGVDPGLITSLHARCGFDATFVKADGARMRWIKAPRPGEPVLPSGCRTVLALSSARALGAPLSPRIAHRVERIETIAGIRQGDEVTPEVLARLNAALAEWLGGLAPETRVIPVINMVDDADRERLARSSAELTLRLAPRFQRVVLVCMARAGGPLVAIVERR